MLLSVGEEEFEANVEVSSHPLPAVPSLQHFTCTFAVLCRGFGSSAFEPFENLSRKGTSAAGRQIVVHACSSGVPGIGGSLLRSLYIRPVSLQWHGW